MLRISVCALLLFTSACAVKPSVSENQCRAGDWETIGYRDGAHGVAETRLLAHQEACGEFQIVPERNAYLSGHRQGLLTYCTRHTGYTEGLAGKGLNAQCRDELAEPYASGHSDGHQVWLVRREVAALDRELASMDQRLSRIREEIVGVTTAQLEPLLSVEERIQLVADLESLLREQEDLRSHYPVVAAELDRAEAELARVQQQVSAVAY